jgi:hypothetical protein
MDYGSQSDAMQNCVVWKSIRFERWTVVHCVYRKWRSNLSTVAHLLQLLLLFWARQHVPRMHLSRRHLSTNGINISITRLLLLLPPSILSSYLMRQNICSASAWQRFAALSCRVLCNIIIIIIIIIIILFAFHVSYTGINTIDLEIVR